MGTMRYRVCSTPGCPNLHAGKGRCPDCIAKAAQQRRPNGNPYNSRGHQAFRHQVLAKHPYCQCRGECGGAHNGICAKRSTIADHWPLERDELIAQGLNPNDPAHGRGLCKSCHDAKTARTKPSGWNARD